MSPFEAVYGFQPLTPLDLSPLPQSEHTNQDGASKAELVRKLHQRIKENIERRTAQYKKQADKGRKELVFAPGDWVWIHMRPERFPSKRSSKLAPRGDGPFKVLERINDNAYRIDIPGEFNISPTFNVTDLSRFDADEPVLRTEPSQGGGNDEDIRTGPDNHPEERMPSPRITRSMARTAQSTHPSIHETGESSNHPSVLPADHPFVPQADPSIPQADHPSIPQAGHPSIPQAVHPASHPSDGYLIPAIPDGPRTRSSMKNVLDGLNLAVQAVINRTSLLSSIQPEPSRPSTFRSLTPSSREVCPAIAATEWPLLHAVKETFLFCITAD